MQAFPILSFIHPSEYILQLYLQVCRMNNFLFMMLLATTTILQGSLVNSFFFNDALPPLASWLPDGNRCKNVYCGNGTCVTTQEAPFIKCECKQGWKQPDLHFDVPFRPCVVPNCTIDYTCSGTNSSNHLSLAPAPSSSRQKISDPLNPCSYDVCGAGNCVRNSNSSIEYQCKCSQGYENIMNVTWGFCSRECELKEDCSRLGFSVSGNVTTIPSDVPDGNRCKNVNCGNGTCVTTQEAPFIKCECKQGWKQPDLYYDLPFRPCVVPNCTIDYTCSNTSSSHLSLAPASSSSLPKISDPLNPCSYNVCGAGNCVRNSNSSIEYQCKCSQGYGNIMNLNWGFCSRECELKEDCTRLGVSVSGNVTADSSTPTNDVQGGLMFMKETIHLVTGSILATLIMLLVK